MLIILHGENFSKSRDIILQLQNKLNLKISEEFLSANKKEFDVTDITPEDLRSEVSSFGLFEDAPFIILDISKAGRKNLNSYLEVVKQAPKEATIVVTSDKSLTKTNIFIKNAKDLNAKIIENSITPKANIYKFIDVVFERDRSTAYKELNKLLQEGEDEFYLLSMLMFNLRNLAIWITEAPEKASLAPFIKTKLSKLAKRYDLQTLREIYVEIYKIDVQMKTGKIPKELSIPLVIEKVSQTANIN